MVHTQGAFNALDAIHHRGLIDRSYVGGGFPQPWALGGIPLPFGSVWSPGPPSVGWAPSVGLGQGSSYAQGLDTSAQTLDFEYQANFCIDEFLGDDQDLGQRAIFHLLDCLINIHLDYLTRYPNLPRVEDAPVYYVADKMRLPGHIKYEEWKSIPSILKRGVADCKDLSSWRIADLQIRDGIIAHPTLQWIVLPSGRQVYHVQVELPNGTIQDPSREKGML